jgi:hypothetical protein
MILLLAIHRAYTQSLYAGLIDSESNKLNKLIALQSQLLQSLQFNLNISITLLNIESYCLVLDPNC